MGNAIAADLTPEMVELLRAGAKHAIGIVCRPSQVQKLWPLLSEAEKRKLIFFENIEVPVITDMGRRAIGAPAGVDADYALFRETRKRKRLHPRPSDDPRTDFDYRSYRSMGYVCTLVVRQPDARYKPTTVRVGRTMTSDPQFLGPRNAIVLQESDGTPFVLALMPKWLLDRTGFPHCPFPLDEDDASWSADDRATWDRLRNVCMSVNIRIRRGGNRQSPAS